MRTVCFCSAFGKKLKTFQPCAERDVLRPSNEEKWKYIYPPNQIITESLQTTSNFLQSRRDKIENENSLVFFFCHLCFVNFEVLIEANLLLWVLIKMSEKRKKKWSPESDVIRNKFWRRNMIQIQIWYSYDSEVYSI